MVKKNETRSEEIPFAQCQASLYFTVRFIMYWIVQPWNEHTLKRKKPFDWVLLRDSPFTSICKTSRTILYKQGQSNQLVSIYGYLCFCRRNWGCFSFDYTRRIYEWPTSPKESISYKTHLIQIDLLHALDLVSFLIEINGLYSLQKNVKQKVLSQQGMFRKIGWKKILKCKRIPRLDFLLNSLAIINNDVYDCATIFTTARWQRRRCYCRHSISQKQNMMNISVRHHLSSYWILVVHTHNYLKRYSTGKKSSRTIYYMRIKT